MKPTQFNSQKSDAALAIELKAVIDQRRVIEEREEELKRYFKTKLGNLGQDTANLGGILISLVPKSRTDIDKKAISAQMGADFLKQFETKTQYVQVDVKEISANLLRRAA
jgi:hypothetical protein